VVCYDLTNKESFQKVRFWVTELLQNEENCQIYVIGTKLDLIKSGTPRAMDKGTVENYAINVGAKTMETSAKTGENVEHLFQTIAQDWSRKSGEAPQTYNPLVLKGVESPNDENPQEGGCSC